MKINFIVNAVFDGWEPTDTRLGGTEEGVRDWAIELSGRGHDVHVYRNSRFDDYRSVTRIENGAWFDYRSDYYGGGDVCINIKSSEIEPLEPTIYYTNEVDASQKDLSRYKAVIHISNWAKENIPVNNPNVFVVPHGYDPKKIFPGMKIPKQCLYASSPDRGLDTLLEAWPRVYEAHPDANLVLTYGGHANLPGVTALGEVDEDTMNELYRTSDIWCHPANGGELQCITGMKAQAAGCVPVIIPTMALYETVKHGFFLTKENYAAGLIQALTNSYDYREKLLQEHFTTIKESTDKLFAVIKNVI